MDILELAGSSRVLPLFDMLGRSLVNWTFSGVHRINIMSRFGRLLIAESPVVGTPLVGKSVMESGVREQLGVSIAGIWERGDFSVPRPGQTINNASVLVLTGTEGALKRFEETYGIYHNRSSTEDPVLIIGGGRVGTIIIRQVEERKVPFIIGSHVGEKALLQSCGEC